MGRSQMRLFSSEFTEWGIGLPLPSAFGVPRRLTVTGKKDSRHGGTLPGGGTWPRLGQVTALRLFAQAREAAGEKVAHFDGATVGDVLEAARERFGAEFGQVVDGSKVWLNGAPCALSDQVAADDEVAVLPPVSGG